MTIECPDRLFRPKPKPWLSTLGMDVPKMPIRDLEYIAHLKCVRENLQHQLDLFEAGKLDLDWFAPRAILAARFVKRAIAEYDSLIAQCRPLKTHKDESLHLF